MNDISVWQGAISQSWSQVWSSIIAGLPSVIGAILVFVIGLVIAFWVKRLVMELLKALKFDSLSKSLGIDDYLKRAEIKLDLVNLLGTITEWILILVFFLAVVDILGLSVVSQVIAKVLGYVPNVFAAALIFAAGYVVARLADGLVRGSLASVDKDVAKPVGKLARWTILIIAFFAAFDQLQIARGLISTFFQGLTYTLVLAIGLSVGLGAKDFVSRLLNDWYDKIKK